MLLRPLWWLIGGCGLEPLEVDPIEVPLDTGAPVTSDTSDTGEPIACADTPDAAEAILATRCAACHGPGSPRFGEFGDALDATALAAGGWVVPGDPENSRILVRIGDDTMPPVSGGGPLSSPEKALIERWIDCGAPDWGTIDTTRGFLSPQMVFAAAREDSQALPSEDPFGPDRKNARYLSLVPLYDAGVPADRIRLYGNALTKLVWSLTTERRVPVLVPVALDGVVLDDGTVVRVAEDLGSALLFRVDLKDFGWDDAPVDDWEELVKGYPFGVRYDREIDDAETLVSFTGSRIPIVAGDWFAANASIPPLYFDVLDVPHTLDAFFLEFGGIPDFRANFAENRVDCAGMDGSASEVSEFNRAICRHDAIAGYCWQSFDFGSVAGQQNLFAFPTDFLSASDGGEVLCALDSGQQVYGVFDALGQRLDAAPINLVFDYTPGSGAIVKPGLHCMNCHADGLVTRVDQVRDTVNADPRNYEDAVVEQVLQWYPPNEIMAELQSTDIVAFRESLAQIPGTVSEEPIWALAQEHEAPLSAVRVAAELGLTETALLWRLETDRDVRAQYVGLYAASGTIDRDVFELAARDTICGIEVGDACDETAFCGLSAVPCPEGSTCDERGSCSRIE